MANVLFNKKLYTMKYDLFYKYVWIVDTLYRFRRLTFNELEELWKRTEMGKKCDLVKRTFHYNRDKIERLFDINIECDRKDNSYYIENPEELEKAGTRSWLLNTFSVALLVNGSSGKVKDRILMEYIPSKEKFLPLIIRAMESSNELTVTYQGYWKDRSSTFRLCPYCLKVFRQRWYLVACFPAGGAPRVYSLDRMHDVVIEKDKFKYPKDFDPEDFFSASYGIIVGEKNCTEDVLIRMPNNKACYLRGLPLHRTQNVVSVDSKHTVFSFQLCPTYDFIQELMSRGADLEVLEPLWLRSYMIDSAQKMLALYGVNG